MYVTVVGVVGTDPDYKNRDGVTPVSRFRLATRERRFDRALRAWVDGATTWVTITCFRPLAVHVKESVRTGESVMAHGRLRVHEWIGDDGLRRSNIEVTADGVGHNLQFGTTRFLRASPPETSAPAGHPIGDQPAHPSTSMSSAQVADLVAGHPGAGSLAQVPGQGGAPHDDEEYDEDQRDDDEDDDDEDDDDDEEFEGRRRGPGWMTGRVPALAGAPG
jgi:single-strand DNA-binding protein